MIAALQAKPGDRIATKWQALGAWVKRQQHSVVGAKAVISYTNSGAKIMARPDEFIQQVRFEVRLTGATEISVGDGRINGLLPKINGVPIIGSINPPQDVPTVKTAEPDEDGFSGVYIKTTHEANGNLKTATIECKNQKELPKSLNADKALGISGFIPIALIEHDQSTKAPIAVYQHSVHNLQVRVYGSTASPQIICWPA